MCQDLIWFHAPNLGKKIVLVELEALLESCAKTCDHLTFTLAYLSQNFNEVIEKLGPRQTCRLANEVALLSQGNHLPHTTHPTTAYVFDHLACSLLLN